MVSKMICHAEAFFPAPNAGRCAEASRHIVQKIPGFGGLVRVMNKRQEFPI